MSSTGRWVGHGCDLAEHRCLCEYGPEVPLTYHSDMQAYADALSPVVWRYRAKIGALLVVALGLPLLLDKQFKSICCSTLTFRPHARKGVMVVVVWHAGWMLLFCGFAPLFLHYGWAAWDMARLGAWPFYTPLAPWGGFGGSGAFLFLVFLVPIMIKDLHFVMHPYAAGSVLTSISWLGFGAGSRPNNLRLLRAALLFPTPSRSY